MRVSEWLGEAATSTCSGANGESAFAGGGSLPPFSAALSIRLTLPAEGTGNDPERKAKTWSAAHGVNKRTGTTTS